MHVHTDRTRTAPARRTRSRPRRRAPGCRSSIFTDHGDAIRAPDSPRYRSACSCIDAVEVSTTGGHVIALGSAAGAVSAAGRARRRARGPRSASAAMSIVAHPTSLKATWSLAVDRSATAAVRRHRVAERRQRVARRAAAGAGAHPVHLLVPRRPRASRCILDRPASALALWDRATRTNTRRRPGRQRRPRPDRRRHRITAVRPRVHLPSLRAGVPHVLDRPARRRAVGQRRADARTVVARHPGRTRRSGDRRLCRAGAAGVHGRRADVHAQAGDRFAAGVPFDAARASVRARAGARR